MAPKRKRVAKKNSVKQVENEEKRVDEVSDKEETSSKKQKTSTSIAIIIEHCKS